MILEFTGLSGAGKTTSEPFIVSGLEQRGYQVVSRSELKNRYIEKMAGSYYENHRWFRFLFHRYYNLVHWKCLIASGMPWQAILKGISSDRLKSFLWLGEDILLSKYYFRNKNKAGPSSVYISEEGFVHHIACCRLFGDSDFPDLFRELVQTFSSEKIVIIYVTISVDEATERLMKRGIPKTWPDNIQSETQVREVLERFKTIIEETISIFEKGGVKVVHLNNSFDPQTLKSKIEENMDALVS